MRLRSLWWSRSIEWFGDEQLTELISASGRVNLRIAEVNSIMTERDRCPRWILVLCVYCLAFGAAGTASGEQDAAVNLAVQYLKAHANGQPTGETAMIALALLKADVPQSDPVVQACVGKLTARFTSSVYTPERGPGPGTYEAAATAMVFSNLDAEAYRAYIAMIATYLMGRQNGNGSWDYSNRSQGDCSISQYAVLGLWEAQNAGVDVSPSTWDRAASWYMSVQSSAGSWNYHRDEGTPETLSMTAAGVGSLMICQRQLERYRHVKRDMTSLLSELVPEGPAADYKPSTSITQVAQAINRGIAWIGVNFAPGNLAVVGQTPYYMFYGIERIGALGDRQTIGRVDWYARGKEFIQSTQKGEGYWVGIHGIEMNTVWATLFLTKSTAKTIRRIKIAAKLGGGTLLGGRELPKDLTSMTVAGGRVVSRPMNGAIEGMLAVLEDPRAEQAEAAVAGLVDRYYVEGPDALRPYKIRFRKMLTDRDPGVRRVAAWALAHTGDLDVVPHLINAMVVANEDEDVVTSIKLGLLLLSRKIQGFGPPTPSSVEQRKIAAQKWQDWYQAIRPLDALAQDEDPVPAAAPSKPAPSAPPSGSSPQ
jgi:hypothetical protein